MIVKVCGLTSKTNLTDLDKLKIDWVGFIFVTKSKRYVGEKEIVNLPMKKKIGVFRNESIDVVSETCQAWRINTIQLHGTETPEYCKNAKQSGFEVIKTIDVKSNVVLDDIVSPYADNVDYFLFDSPGGGTGNAFDWNILDSYSGDVPFLLAGGIAPGFGESLLKIRHPQFKGVDLNSRFEMTPGQKDISLLKKFLTHELSR